MALVVLTDISASADSRTLSWTIASLATGDVIVIPGWTWDQGQTLGTPSGTGLSFTKRVEINQASKSHGYIWTAVASAGGTNIVVTATTAGGNNLHTGVLYQCPTADGYSLAATPNTTSGVGTGTPSGSVSSSSGNLILSTNADWDGKTGTATYIGTSTEDGKVQSSTNNSQYYWHQDGAATSTSIGMTAPTGQSWALMSIEVLKSSGGSGTTVSVPAGSLALTGQVPTVTATANQFISVPAGVLTLSGKVPTVLTPVTIAVPAGSLTLTANAPTVTLTANQIVSVPAGSLTLTANAPTVTATANQFIAVPAGSLTLSALIPTVAVSGSQTIAVPAGSLTLTANAPTVIATANVTVDVPAGSLVLAANAPLVQTSLSIFPPAGALTLTAFAPTVTVTANVLIDIPLGTLSLNALAPDVLGDLTQTDTHDGSLKREKPRFDDSAQTQVIRESQLKPKPRKSIKSDIVPASAPILAITDEDLMIYQRIEDEEATSLTELLDLTHLLLKRLQ